MNNMQELIKKICEGKNYEKILLKIQKSKNNSSINKILNDISSNNKLTEIEKRKYYEGIFDYVKDINDNFEKNIEDIYFQGAKDAVTKIILLKNNIIENGFNNHERICKSITNKLEQDMQKQNQILNIDIYKTTVFDFIKMLNY